jgi:hypothetical protein
VSRPLALFAFLLLAACGSNVDAPAATDDPSLTPCNADCPAGQTCWTVDGKAWSCATAGAGKLGDTCDASINAPASCSSGIVCLATTNPSAGTCVAWCDALHPCPALSSCQKVITTKGVPLHVCL